MKLRKNKKHVCGWKQSLVNHLIT